MSLRCVLSLGSSTASSLRWKQKSGMRSGVGSSSSAAAWCRWYHSRSSSRNAKRK
nr:MAG: hypothetical protein [Molluscum contagiosum virus]